MFVLQGTILFMIIFAMIHQVNAADGFKETELTEDTWEAMTSGKSAVFIKVFAPWCGHCKEMAPHWNNMAREWAGNNKHVLVASVDCTKDESWCLSMGIQGFPTLLYGDPSHGGVFLQTYSGDKTYEALSEFANETLTKGLCSPSSPDECDATEKEKINVMWKLSLSDLHDSIEEKEKEIESQERNFQKAFEAMQAQYDQHSQEHEMRVAQVRSNIKLLKSFLSSKK